MGIRVDTAALAALADVRLGWPYKGFPTRYDGRTVAELIAARPALAELATPLLVIEAAAVEHNVETMARFCAARGVDLAPHVKTAMAPQLVARQLAAGAWGVSAATIAQVRVFRAFGVDRVVLANELVDPDALAWLAAEMHRRPTFRPVCFVDSVNGVRTMRAVLAAVQPPRPLDVVVELGAPAGRAGCRDADAADAVAREVAGSGWLRLVGAGGFEGALAQDRSALGVAAVRTYLRELRDLVLRLDRSGLFGAADEILATAGGSAYFDDVADILGGIGRLSRRVRVVLRSGAYVLHDDGHYREVTPLQGPEGFRPALRIRGRVLSMPEPGLALLDFGKRDVSFDLGLPVPRTVTRTDGSVERLDGCTVTTLADQHAFLSYGIGERLAVGDVVSCGVSHPCTALDKWRLIPVVDGDRVVDVIRTFF